ncbi:serine O-acetyltransferase [Marihabitans asiaticum]|uniref:Serine acetyltransferase n=1 Tax=Marihabitans asiaticum TaxID=415218 RepID=A0A560WE07_9MICO|nr:serine O-acetyltransferase [Marihabitans asiaticum]TWD15862.1 serine O-acetyltransferase [Marihabitans asiaticum]
MAHLLDPPSPMPEHPSPWMTVREDVAAAMRRDPAATSRLVVLLTSAGLHAIWLHRLAHRWWCRPGMKWPARILAYLSRMITGVEIHPGAHIGRRFFIDHGVGVVIGETAVIGDDCMLYHQVTLGGTSHARVKRHPTLADNVLVGAGAKILGPVHVGSGVKVGANSVVVKDVPTGAVATGAPATYRFPQSEANPPEARVAREDLPYLDPAMFI